MSILPGKPQGIFQIMYYMSTRYTLLYLECHKTYQTTYLLVCYAYATRRIPECHKAYSRSSMNILSGMSQYIFQLTYEDTTWDATNEKRSPAN